LLKHALRVIRKGYGFPSIFNTDIVIEEQLRQGKSLEDARAGGCSGCVETGAFGKEAFILTGYFNLVKILEITLHDGLDPRTGMQLGLRNGEMGDKLRTISEPQNTFPGKSEPSDAPVPFFSGATDDFASFDALFQAYRRQVHHFLEIKLRGNQIIEQMYAALMPAPFLSVITDDCIRKGKDYNAGGARYNNSYVQFVGIGSLTDSLSVLKQVVFDDRTMPFSELLRALDADFDGHETLRQRLLNRMHKYGNDDQYADQIMVRAFQMIFDELDGRPNSKGGHYRVEMLPTTSHVYFGSITGATPDGRKAGMPLSEGISPAQGADRQGPTAVFKSAGKMDHVKTGGTLLNMKFTPALVSDENGIYKMTHLVRGYFKLGGHHVQFNIVRAETLREAQTAPEQHRDLIVRVAGYSDYFCDLSRELQDEIITRTEHGVLETSQEGG
jgi:formate C-acetyltransferase